MKLKKIGLITVITVIILIPFIQSSYKGMQTKESKLKEITEFRELIKIIQNTVSKNSVIAIQENEAVAWYADRVTLCLPASTSILETIDKDIIPVEYIIITSREIDNEFKVTQEWRDIFYNGKQIDGYNKINNFINGDLKAFIFKRSLVNS